METPTPSPLRAVALGLAAGLAGTAAMTGYQMLVSRIKSARSDGSDKTGGSDESGGPETWEDAPAPAQVGQRVVEGVFDRSVSPEHIGLMTNSVHTIYGVAWGAVYGLAQGWRRGAPVVRGPLFGLGVWAQSYAALVPMGLYEPPWRYSTRTIAKDVSYHLVYGAGTAVGYEVLARLARR